MYSFADALGTGLGSSVLSKQGLRLQIGVWGGDGDDEMSSNWKEFSNVVEALEIEGSEGNLDGALLFLNSDSSTVEQVMYKGNSKSPLLHELVIRAKRLEVKYKCKILVSHVPGKRMISQGTDGLSRGIVHHDVNSITNVIENIPFHMGAVERSKDLTT